MRRRAVVAGAAAVGGAMAGKKSEAAAAEQAEQPAGPEQTDDKFATLEKLAELHKSGALTDEEFAQQKAQILGS